MKKTIFYWSPCLNKVGTVISTKNSAISIAKYKKNQFDVKLINACGEWDEYKNDLTKNGVDVIDFDIETDLCENKISVVCWGSNILYMT